MKKISIEELKNLANLNQPNIIWHYLKLINNISISCLSIYFNMLSKYFKMFSLSCFYNNLKLKAKHPFHSVFLSHEHLILFVKRIKIVGIPRSISLGFFNPTCKLRCWDVMSFYVQFENQLERQW